MRKLRFALQSLVFAILTLAFTSAAQAQATRTFVSGVGNDADPCRTFAGAPIKTFINGEINALDPGGYGTVNITKSITIDGNGTHCSTLTSGTLHSLSGNSVFGNTLDGVFNSGPTLKT
jgi:hypothetical protein